jgi:hypothetical protein
MGTPPFSKAKSFFEYTAQAAAAQAWRLSYPIPFSAGILHCFHGKNLGLYGIIVENSGPRADPKGANPHAG